jgi:tetratricopeptide (TPR) repeat protein
LPGAAALYRESLELRERASALDTKDVFARQALGYCLVQLSELARQMGDTPAAVAYGRRAVAAYGLLPPSQFFARRGQAWFVFGQAASKGGDRAEACRAFRRAGEEFDKARTAPAIEREMLRSFMTVPLAAARDACSPQAALAR